MDVKLSFVELLEGYGRSRPPALVRAEGEDIAAWQARFRAAIDGLRGPLPDRVPLQPEVIEEHDAGDHLRRLVLLQVSELSTLPAYLLMPKDLAPGERRPAVIASHGHVADGIDATCGVADLPPEDLDRRYGLFAVQAGYVVLAPAWWGWRGRDGHVPLVGARDKCNVIQMAAQMYGINVIDLHIQDGQAAVDYLVSLPEVDPTAIGCLGNSYGGRTTMWLTIDEPRIAACVPTGCLNTFRERSLKLSSCGVQYRAGLLRYGDVPELFSLIAPRPMQLQAGDADALINRVDRDLIAATVAAAYRDANAPDHLDLAYNAGGHYLQWSLAEPFLAKHLKREG